jgi:PAS domain S-box-containing protein
LDVPAAASQGRFVAMDAAEAIEGFMAGGSPDPARFAEVAGAPIVRASRGGRAVRVFGELPAILWERGETGAAIRLEKLRNALATSHGCSLYGAYPIRAFEAGAGGGPFNRACKVLSKDVPPGRPRAIAPDEPGERDRDLADFFDNAPFGLHWVGPDGVILRANQAELDMLGYAREEYVGRPISDFHADAEVIEDILRRLRAGETLHNLPARLRCKDGSIRHVLISSNVLRVDGAFIHTRCLTRDVTDLKRAEDELREANRRKDEFLATLAHELRTPLAPISNALYLMRRKAADGRDVEPERAMAERQVARLARLVDDLMDVARIGRGKVELHKRVVDLAAVARDAVESSRAQIDLRGHELSLSLPEGPVRVEGDPSRLEQVLCNLLTNASKYTEPGGTIGLTVEADEDRGLAVVRVRDTGVGIAADMLPRVFDMFLQVEGQSERSQGGLGIGLSLVKTLVEMQGGTISAHSDGPGRGSEFVVRLPVASSPDAARPAPGALQNGAGGSEPPRRRILVVDDDVDAADSLAWLLSEAYGQAVAVAHDGASALETVDGFRPDVVVLDVGMPGMDGREVARRLRARPEFDRTMLVALSGWGQESDRRLSKDAGFDAHLVKPANPDALLALLADTREDVAARRGGHDSWT